MISPFSPVFNQVFHKPSETKQKSAYKKPTHSAKSRMIPCVLYFFDERYEEKIIIMLHIVFLLALFSLFLDASMILCIMVLLHSLIYQASVLSVVECLLYATLEAHYIFLLTIILLSSLSVARVNVQDVCFLACMRIFRQHDSERRQKQFPQLINKLEESDTEET